MWRGSDSFGDTQTVGKNGMRTEMTTTVNPYAYSITVREIDFDGDSNFEARVKELSDVREYGASGGEAYDW